MAPTSTKQGVEYDENGGRPNKEQDRTVDRRKTEHHLTSRRVQVSVRSATALSWPRPLSKSGPIILSMLL